MPLSSKSGDNAGIIGARKLDQDQSSTGGSLTLRKPSDKGKDRPIHVRIGRDKQNGEKIKATRTVSVAG